MDFMTAKAKLSVRYLSFFIIPCIFKPAFLSSDQDIVHALWAILKVMHVTGSHTGRWFRVP